MINKIFKLISRNTQTKEIVPLDKSQSSHNDVQLNVNTGDQKIEQKLMISNDESELSDISIGEATDISKGLGLRLSTREAAIYVGVSKQRISAKISDGHYTGVSKCECGLTTMIPISEINKDIKAGNVTRNLKKPKID